MKKQRVEAADSDRLCAALACGVVEMLGDAGVLRVLWTSHWIRHDERVVGCALRRIATERQWLALDIPQLTTSPAAVALVWCVQAFLSQEIDRNCLHPILFGCPASGSPDDLLQEAWRAVSSTSARAPPPNSVFRSHWDHIASRDDCALCEAALSSVCQYREDTEAFMSAFEDQLAAHEAQWEADGASPTDALDKGFAFQQAYFENEPFFNTYVANQDDAAVLEHICGCGRFPCGSVESTATLSVAARESCRRLYRPLKRLLTTLCPAPLVRTSSENAEIVGGRVQELFVGVAVLY